MSLSSDIREFGLALGYDRVGFATTEKFTLYEEELQRRHDMYSWATGPGWGLSQGADPRTILPDAESIVVAVFDYFKHSFPQQMVGKVERAYQSLGGAPPIPIHRARYRLLREFLERQGGWAEPPLICLPDWRLPGLDLPATAGTHLPSPKDSVRSLSSPPS